MEDSTKVGIAAGGIVAAIGAMVSCYMAGHSSGHSGGLAEGLELGAQKYDDLNNRLNAALRKVDELKMFKEKLEQQNDRAVASAEEIYRLSRG